MKPAPSPQAVYKKSRPLLRQQKKIFYDYFSSTSGAINYSFLITQRRHAWAALFSCTDPLPY
ncbi:hypothetical protein [Pantoea sp. M_9]|uniref:hypothetical protein n=1 Tax=Pantoea sp. M_9 TaxID=2608041 RepID=UPI001231C25C|nr:hypothetical protein [Pantoea sp. M_9]KAA5966995.1 hypothetical protein F3I15_13880 [Pantoea sp. M_9]